MADTVKHKLSNLIHDVKEKVTDQEYKELMETLALVGTEPVQNYTDAKLVRYTYRQYRYTHPQLFIDNLHTDDRDQLLDNAEDIGELYKFKLAYMSIKDCGALLQVVESDCPHHLNMVKGEISRRRLNYLIHQCREDHKTMVVTQNDDEATQWYEPIKVEVVV